MLRSVKSSQMKPLILGFKITDSAGTPSLDTTGGMDGSLVDTGVGVYDITFKRKGDNLVFGRVPVVVATPRRSAGDVVATVIPAVGGVTVKLWDATDGTTAKDGDVDVLVFGYEGPDPV